MCAAVSARVLAVRAQMARCAPSRDSSSATAQPSPLLAAATMATRPVSPRSIPAPRSKLQSSRDSRAASIQRSPPWGRETRLPKPAGGLRRDRPDNIHMQCLLVSSMKLVGLMNSPQFLAEALDGMQQIFNVGGVRADGLALKVGYQHLV